MKPTLLVPLLLLAAALSGTAQRTAREEEPGGTAAPRWTNAPAFRKDVFTFVRVKYSVDGRHGYGNDPANRWRIDFPDSDLNFSFRLQQMTSLRVDPNGKVLELTDPELFHYPFLYLVEPGRWTLTEPEVPILRRYLLSGGFLMVDDFWGDREWHGFEEEMSRVFPERKIQDLGLDHPIFQRPFPISGRPQVPGQPWFTNQGLRRERPNDPTTEEAHYRAIVDDRGRIMVMICHNTDLGDGWEREGDNEAYFHEFSEKYAYPLGINIVFYAMTH